jgi:hypothetical protein
MNTLTIYLSSSSLSGTNIRPEIELEDKTTLTFNLSGLSEEYFPSYLLIDWGDGVSEKFDANLYKKYREESIFEEVMYGKFSQIVQNTYDHVYHPSPTTLFNSISAQFLVKYSNGDYVWFIQPIKVRSYDFYESLGGVRVVNTVILDDENNSSEHQLLSKTGQLIELTAK